MSWWRSAERTNVLKIQREIPRASRVRITAEQFHRSNIELIGAPGSGKTALAGNLLSQAIMQGDAVYIVDPKNDVFLPSVMAHACEQAKVPFRFIDLAGPPQFNLIADISFTELTELFIAGFGLESKGIAADFYRLADREAARTVAMGTGTDWCTIGALVANQGRILGRDLSKRAAGFVAMLDELGEVRSIAGDEGLNGPIENGGCCYVAGSLVNEGLLRLTRMMLVRVIQLVRQPDRVKRPVSIFVDELRYSIHRPLLSALGTIRDRGGNILFAHQSLGDFPDITTKATILDNAGLRFAFRCTCPITAAWLAALTGTIPINEGRAQRHYIDENMIQNLPDGRAIFVGDGPARIVKVKPTKVKLRTFHSQESASLATSNA